MQTIKWFPSGSPNIIAYEIWKSDEGRDAPYTLLIQLLNQIPGPNWDSVNSYFYYNDIDIPYRYYRIKVLDNYGNVAEDEAPTPFQAGNDPVVTPSLHTIALNANSGGTNNLQYVSQGGTPIKDATIRVYRKVDYETNNLTKVVGSTVTSASGTWVNPVFVEPGETYKIVYHKVNEYGPDTAEITV